MKCGRRDRFSNIFHVFSKIFPSWLAPSVSLLPSQAVIVSTMISFGPFIRVQLQFACMSPLSNLLENPSNRTITSHIFTDNRSLWSLTNIDGEKNEKGENDAAFRYSRIDIVNQARLCGDLTSKRFTFNNASSPVTSYNDFYRCFLVLRSESATAWTKLHRNRRISGEEIGDLV